MKNISQTLKIIALALAFSFGLSYVYAWTAPTAPPPGGNTSAPINTGSTTQWRLGNFGIGTTVAPIRALQVNGELSITRNDKTAFINVSDINGNGGGSIILRGLDLTGSVGTNANITLQGTTTVTGGKLIAPDICTSSGKCLSGIYTPGSQTFTASGYFTVPGGVTSLNVETWGGGGGGGWGATGTNYTGYKSYTTGGGGGAGGYTKKLAIPVVAGQQFYVTVGNSGYSASKPTNIAYYTQGGTGGMSVLYDYPSWTTVLSANGGTGGISHNWYCNGGSCNGDVQCTSTAPNAAGGTATGGTTNTTGAIGGKCLNDRPYAAVDTPTIFGGVATLDHNGVTGFGAGGNGSMNVTAPTAGGSGRVVIWW